MGDVRDPSLRPGPGFSGADNSSKEASEEKSSDSKWIGKQSNRECHAKGYQGRTKEAPCRKMCEQTFLLLMLRDLKLFKWRSWFCRLGSAGCERAAIEACIPLKRAIRKPGVEELGCWNWSAEVVVCNTEAAEA